MRYAVGIDEVGRGSLAGPVTVAAIAAPASSMRRIADSKKRKANNRLGELRDSKRLTPLARERWFKHLTNHPQVSFAIARVYPRMIERVNIAQAANLAARRAYNKLTTNNLKLSKHRVFLDGGLYLANKKWQRANSNARTVVRGDEKVRVIAMASILAKVTRDRAMVRLARKYPNYGFESHKGYGTKMHLKAVKKHGPSEVHRATFLS